MGEENNSTAGDGVVDGGAGAGTPGAAGTDDGEGKGERTRLSQRVKELEGLNQQAVPYIKFVEKLRKTKVGQAVVDKFVKGEDFEDLLPGEQQAVAKAAGEGLTAEKVQEMLEADRAKTTQEISTTLSAREEARERNRELDIWAKEKFPGYESLKGTPAWNGVMDAVFGAIRNGTMVPREGEDPWQFAIAKGYALAVADNPEVGKKKAAASSETDRLASLLAGGGRRPPSSKQSGNDDPEKDLPEDAKRRLAQIRSIGGGGVGKSFANPGAKRE